MTSKSGYSVFEVLLAFTIMSLVLSALLPGQARLLARANDSEASLIAHDYALSRLAHLGTSEPLVAGSSVFQDGELQILQSVTEQADVVTSASTFNILIVVQTAEGKEVARVSAKRSTMP